MSIKICHPSALLSYVLPPFICVHFCQERTYDYLVISIVYCNASSGAEALPSLVLELQPFMLSLSGFLLFHLSCWSVSGFLFCPIFWSMFPPLFCSPLSSSPLSMIKLSFSFCAQHSHSIFSFFLFSFSPSPAPFCFPFGSIFSFSF